MSRSFVLTMACAIVSVGVTSAQEWPGGVPKPTVLYHCPAPIPPKSADDAVKNALACDWLDATAAPHMLAALKYLTIPSVEGRVVEPDLGKAFAELSAGDPTHACIFGAAMGLRRIPPCGIDTKELADGANSDNFRDWLAKASTKGYETESLKALLFSLAEGVVGVLLASPQGNLELREIQNLFANNGGGSYVALYHLLADVPRPNPPDAAYLQNLEILRTAFAVNGEQLASLVSEKVSGAKK